MQALDVKSKINGLNLLLLLAAVALLSGLLLGWLRWEQRRWERNDWRGRSSRPTALVIGAVLAGAAMAFHSLGDFSLQMPATVWLLAAVVALALAEVVRRREDA